MPHYEHRLDQGPSVANSSKVTSDILARVIDRCPGRSGELILIKRKPNDDMCIDEDYLSSPHSSGEIAGETMSPVTTPLPARKL
jgi:hypothetical protein